MALNSRIAAPVVWLLDASTKLIFHLLGQSRDAESAVTEDEVKIIMADAGIR
jgi:putative hemolysin